MSYFLKARDIKKNWVVIDAAGVVLGRLSSYLVTILKGKHKCDYTPHMDCGDQVVVINAAKVSLTGKKMDDKIYYRHTGYPGGIKSDNPRGILAGKDPCRLLKGSVRRMLGHGPMSRQRLKNLYVYPGPEHKHSAQKPFAVDFSSMNTKNVR